jgi:hypothetical protein
MFSGFDPSGMFAELHDVAGALIDLMGVLGLLIGAILMASAGRLLVKGDARTGEPNLMGAGVRSLIGAMLMQFAHVVSMLQEETAGVGSGVRTAMMDSVPAAAGNGLWGLALNAIFMWVACIGGFAIMRGLMLWNKHGSGDSQGGGGDAFWGGFWHVLAGAVCMNMGISNS